VIAGVNLVAAGATQAGKTTLLNCLASAILTHERLVTCEEAQVRCTCSKFRLLLTTG
jgi:Flp pilus assembly CpaF family ATPase